VNNTNSRLPHTKKKKKQKRHTASKVEKMFYDFLLLASVVEEHSVKTVIGLRFVLIFLVKFKLRSSSIAFKFTSNNRGDN
jgi:hypothetical protein